MIKHALGPVSNIHPLQESLGLEYLRKCGEHALEQSKDHTGCAGRLQARPVIVAIHSQKDTIRPVADELTVRII